MEGTAWIKRRHPRHRATADRWIGRRIRRAAGHVRQLERMGENRRAPFFEQGTQAADVVEVSVGQQNRARPLATEELPCRAADSRRVSRYPGVDQRPLTGGAVMNEIQVHDERAKPMNPGGDFLSAHAGGRATGMPRYHLLMRNALVFAALLVSAALGAQAPAPPTFDLEEATIADLQQRMQSGRETARSLTEKYIARIERIDRSGPTLRSVLELNPDALAIADRLDAERNGRGARGPLHGIPILIKDNIATADGMMTTAGSLALAGVTPPKDAFVAARLREAGAVVLGKTNLSEWANFRSTHSTSGWSGRGGQTRNPYALDRNPSGSSSGSGAAIAANLAAAAVGTETDGSIVSPANNNGLVGIKPTLGLVSRSGIVPIAHSQDTAGPMTRTGADAAVLLGALAGADPEDRATRGAKVADYAASLDPNGLKGARIGV